jgi:hypothetical protein
LHIQHKRRRRRRRRRRRCDLLKNVQRSVSPITAACYICPERNAGRFLRRAQGDICNVIPDWFSGRMLHNEY